MRYTIRQWPGSVQKKEIQALPLDAETAVMVMLQEMMKRGPILDEYHTKRLSKNLHGLLQVNLKINREQIRVLYFVEGAQIVVVHVFKKTSPQVEQRGYALALERKKAAELILKDDEDGITTIH